MPAIKCDSEKLCRCKPGKGLEAGILSHCCNSSAAAPRVRCMREKQQWAWRLACPAWGIESQLGNQLISNRAIAHVGMRGGVYEGTLNTHVGRVKVEVEVEVKSKVQKVEWTRPRSLSPHPTEVGAAESPRKPRPPPIRPGQPPPLGLHPPMRLLSILATHRPPSRRPSLPKRKFACLLCTWWDDMPRCEQWSSFPLASQASQASSCQRSSEPQAWQRSTPRISQGENSTLFHDDGMPSCQCGPPRFAGSAC